jgi:hypothetical protein
MLFICLLVVALIVSAAVIHYEVLWRLNVVLPHLPVVPRRARVLAAIVGAFSSHFIQISLFALAYYLLNTFAGTAFSPVGLRRSYASFLYFSAETYTSLGLGDMYPLGAARLVVGVESIVGLLMISWSASFTYLEMRKYWDHQPAQSAAGNEGRQRDSELPIHS